MPGISVKPSKLIQVLTSSKVLLMELNSGDSIDYNDAIYTRVDYANITAAMNVLKDSPRIDKIVAKESTKDAIDELAKGQTVKLPPRIK